MAVVGRVHGLREEISLEWTIPEFSTMLTGKVDDRYDSPAFAFSDTLWYLGIHPNGEEEFASEGHIGLYLILKEFTVQQKIDYDLSFKKANGEEEYKTEITHEFAESNEGCGRAKFCARSQLDSRQSELFPDDVLTVCLTMKKSGRRRLHQAPLLERLLNVSHSMKKILDDGENTDVVFEVDQKEIRVHGVVLKARSQVFQNMLEHDMQEKRTGRIVIDDMEEDVLRELLAYVYCGRAEVTTDNALPLYLAANKYDLKELKTMCSVFVEENISDDLFCDFYAVADACDDSALVRLTKEYFEAHSLRVMETERWKRFAVENHNLAIQLLTTMLKINASKDSNK